MITINLTIDHHLPDGMYELSFDVYPVDDPSHPDRHIGYWNTPIPLASGSSRSLQITWDPSSRTALFNGLPPRTVWIGEMPCNQPCRAFLGLYDQGGNRVSVQSVDLEKISHVADVRMTTGGPRDEDRLSYAIWFLTWRCNFRCPYCWEVQRQATGECAPEPFLPLDDIVAAWNRLCPKILDITGGEPFLQPHFVDFLERLDDRIKVAITTNLSLDLTEFVRKILPEKVVHITASLHPTQRMSTDLFLGKCLLLRNRGFSITVNFVTWPEQMWLIPHYKSFFEGHGIPFHVDPYAPTPHYPFQWSDSEKEFLRPYVGEDRSHWFGEVEIYPVRCSAGKEHINVQPNGDAYRCINDKILGKPRIGNIFDPDFTPNREWTRCDDYYRCAGCDRDKIRVERIGSEKATTSPPFSMTL